jgi:predicted membrane chloride channel (bestrophin family)
MFWLVLLPFAVFPAVQSSTEPRVVTIWFSALVLFFLALLLLSIDEISNQLEDPWYSLPLITIARSSRQAVESAASMSRLVIANG